MRKELDGEKLLDDLFDLIKPHLNHRTVDKIIYLADEDLYKKNKSFFSSQNYPFIKTPVYVSWISLGISLFSLLISAGLLHVISKLFR